MRALRFSKFGSVDDLSFSELPDPVGGPGTAIVKIVAASINPSDVKNVEGKMERSTVPRIPGRDYAGVVVEGPQDWRGAEVWGTGGEIGYTVDGSHAELIAVPVASLARKPAKLGFPEAATVGVTYMAAWLGVVEYARLQSAETLLVVGAAGGVGSSTARIGRMLGARVICSDRAAPPPGSDSPDEAVVGPAETLVDQLMSLTEGRGADVVFDTVGGVMFEPALRCLAPRGRLVEIASAGTRRVSFDPLDFYHNESRIFGADTRHRNAIQSAVFLEAFRRHFESGAFVAPAIDQAIPLSDGVAAYRRLERGEARGRLVLQP